MRSLRSKILIYTLLICSAALGGLMLWQSRLIQIDPPETQWHVFLMIVFLCGAAAFFLAAILIGIGLNAPEHKRRVAAEREMHKRHGIPFSE